MNYLPKGIAVVERDPITKLVIGVKAVWQGQMIPFVMKNKEVVRDDYLNPARPFVPENNFIEMCNQVKAVFRGKRARARAKDLFWLVQDLNKCGVSIKGRGQLAITRWDKKNGQKPKLIKQTVEDIETAIRMQEHIIDSYRSDDEANCEIAKLESIELVITEANQILLNWGEATAEEKDRLQKQLTRVVLQLEKCRNEFKVAARRQAEQIVPLRDSLGRPNPGAFAARTIAALSDLMERIKELNIIMPYIAMRKELLILADRWLKFNLSQAAGIITIVSRHRVFKSGIISQHEPKIINLEIDRADSLLNNVIISPHRQLAIKARTELKVARKLIGEEGYASTLQKLNHARELLQTPV